MPDLKTAAVLAAIGLIASTAPSFAFGSIGCNNLPEHDRAVGTIENGPYSCGMSTEEANRILARDSSGAAQPFAPAVAAPRKHHHHRTTPPM